MQWQVGKAVLELRLQQLVSASLSDVRRLNQPAAHTLAGVLLPSLQAALRCCSWSAAACLTLQLQLRRGPSQVRLYRCGLAGCMPVSPAATRLWSRSLHAMCSVAGGAHWALAYASKQPRLISLYPCALCLQRSQLTGARSLRLRARLAWRSTCRAARNEEQCRCSSRCMQAAFAWLLAGWLLHARPCMHHICQIWTKG